MEILEFQWHIDCFLKCNVNNLKETTSPRQFPRHPHAFPLLSLLQNTTQPKMSGGVLSGEALISLWLYILFKVKVAQSCPTLCDPMDHTIHGIPLARILEWVAFPFSRGSSQPRDRTRVSCIPGRFFTSWATRKAHFLFKTAATCFRCSFSYFKNIG